MGASFPHLIEFARLYLTLRTPSTKPGNHSLSRLAWQLHAPLCQNNFMATETRDIQKHVLPNGLVVITETMPHVRSVSVGVWVRNGSRREVPQENGLAHFMEHMVFKGTERRSAEAIAREMDSVGGMLDAFTSKEQICLDRKSTRLNSSHSQISYAVFCLKKKKKKRNTT